MQFGDAWTAILISSDMDEDKHIQSDKCVPASQFSCSQSSKDEQKGLNLFVCNHYFFRLILLR